jgi:glyoxalase family protein
MTDIAPHGLHHVTAIASDPQANVDFYTTVLGLRLVKRTVNFDAPDTYHLYYGDESGSPSSILTFFPWRGVPAGRQGSGITTATAFSVPPESLGWWAQRVAALGIDHEGPRARDGEEVLTFRDPDGLVIDVVAAPGDTRSGWDGYGHVPAEHAVRGLHSVTLSETVPDRATQELWRAELAGRGVNVTEIRDRQYFTSIYFHEPGGVLLEIATDEPGFAIDEPLLELGRSLKLPPWLEPSREQIAASLPTLEVPR